MSDKVTADEKFPDSLAGLWNEKLRLSSQIEALLRPFCAKYQLRMDQVVVECGYTGVYLKVTL